MPSDSVSTFLDIRATGALPKPEQAKDPEVARRAEALAKIAGGVTNLDQLTATTSLSGSELQETVKWLADNGLVELRFPSSGTTELSLTPTAESALE